MGDFNAPMHIGGGAGASGGPDKMGGYGPELGTLDEPVSHTIMRDVTMVGNKMMCVLNPRKANIQTLKNWDLWGPLILCLMLATLLSWFAPYDQKSLVFASVFVIVWLGAAVVTVNALLLGGNISFFQSVCVLGYCIFPLNIASFICLLGGAAPLEDAGRGGLFFLVDGRLARCAPGRPSRDAPVRHVARTHDLSSPPRSRHGCPPEAPVAPPTPPSRRAQGSWGSLSRRTARRLRCTRSSSSTRPSAG